MSESNREDISIKDLEYTFISLLSNKINVLIVGGGKAGFIKAKSFANSGCNVSVVSKSFADSFESIKHLKNISLITDTYKTEYILNKHIVVIATDDENLNHTIKEECESHFKIYLYAQDFKQGLFSKPVQGSTNNIEFAIGTRSGSPKTSVFLSKIMEGELRKYDSFAEYSGCIRKTIESSELKSKVMDFVNTKDFYYFFNLGKEKLVLKMFYGDDKFEF